MASRRSSVVAQRQLPAVLSATTVLINVIINRPRGGRHGRLRRVDRWVVKKFRMQSEK
jgi:hypothetical protein